jgi:hypothetical protein
MDPPPAARCDASRDNTTKTKIRCELQLERRYVLRSGAHSSRSERYLRRLMRDY